MTTQDSSWLGLQGRVCVITGAGGGIGRATALGFTTAGAKVVLLDRDQANLDQTAQMVASAGGREPVVVVCDVSDPGRVEAAGKHAERLVGGCNVLVNNAGLLQPGSLDSISLSEWNALISVNLTGYLLCSQVFGGQMRAAGGGSIVHIASIAGTHPQSFSGAYSVSKTGVIMLSRQLAVEWGPDVRSNVISPGLVETPMSRAFYEVEGVRERRSAVTPARRIGKPQDMADAVLFLASDRASYVTGEELLVDGGYSRMLMSFIPRPGYGKQAQR